MNKQLSQLSKVAIAEGVSFLVLMLIAMPLKYFYDWPYAVKVFGWLHGILFVAFLWLAWNYKNDKNKNYTWFALAFAASLLPAGTFFFDRKLKKEEH